MNVIIERIERKESNTPTNLMNGERSNYKRILLIKRGSRTTCYWEWIFQHGEVEYTQYQQWGGKFIHNPIHSDTDIRDDTRVVGTILNPLFVFILPTILSYHIHLPWHAVMDIKIAGYKCKGIEIGEINMPGCARISESLHMKIQTSAFIETLKALGSDFHWWSWNIIPTLDHAVDAISRDESDAVFYWKGESLEEYWCFTLNNLIWL